MRFGHRSQPQATVLETDATKEIPLGARLHIEITRVKKSKDDPLGKRVIIGKKKINWRGGRYTFYCRGKKYYFVDTQALMWESKVNKKRIDKGHWKLQFDEHICEPLGKDGKTSRSSTVSAILRDEFIGNVVTIASTILPVEINRTTAIAMIVAGFAIGVIGFGWEPLFHTAPNTVIHWLPSAPRIGP